VNIRHSYGQWGGLCRALSLAFSGEVVMRTKCMRQPHSCLLLWQIFTDLKKIFTDRLSNKSFLIRLFTTPLHVATPPCNILLVACFLKLNFHKVVWKHMQGVVGFSVTFLLQIYYRSSLWKNFENRLKFDRDITMSMMSPFLWNTVYIQIIDKKKQKFKYFKP